MKLHHNNYLLENATAYNSFNLGGRVFLRIVHTDNFLQRKQNGNCSTSEQVRFQSV